MDISYNWLKDLIDTNLTPNDLAEKLTSVGLAVEGIEKIGDDSVFDIDLTSNRGDCLSHLGTAREIAAITNCELRNTKYENSALGTKNSELVKIEDADLCRRFTARIVRNVRIAPSPNWLKKRLEAVGERSINNVADITNYVMLELGNPMHAFDLAKLSENRIVVRRAKNGETIKTLDEVERRLDETMLAICDAEKPVAVAGIMGGFDSSISEETTDVLIEVAYFDQDNIRQTSRKLNLSTEASYRFERGVDIENLIRASNRAAELVVELAGGEIGEFADVYSTKFIQNEIESNNIQKAVKRLTGLNVEENEVLRILNALGIKQKSEIRNPKSEIYIVPTWRHDLSIEEDLVEEVARVVGYDKIAVELPPATSAGSYQPNETDKKLLRQALKNSGFDEAISYSFIDVKADEKIDFVPNLFDRNTEEKFVSLRDSVIEGAIRMRPTLVSGLLDAVKTNLNRGRRNLQLFEIGRVFAAGIGEVENLPIEKEHLGIVLTGGETLQNKAVSTREFDFYDAKGAIENALEAIGFSDVEFESANTKHLRNGQTAAILLNGEIVGFLGRLSEELNTEYKFKQPVFIAEIDLQSFLYEKTIAAAYKSLPIYPSSIRDVSLLINRSTSFDKIRRTVVEQGYELLQSVQFVDIYEGKGMADNERSVTIRLEYRSDKKTLLDEEVDNVHIEILKNLEQETGAKLRS